jgi:protein TonB
LAPNYLNREMSADLHTPRRARVSIALGVVLLHALAFTILIRAFAPDFGQTILNPAIRAFDVVIDRTPPVRPPVRPPEPTSAPLAEAPSGLAGRRATPRAIAAPPVHIALAPLRAPPVVGNGSENDAGAQEQGPGVGAGASGSGNGTGSVGMGGGGATKPIKIAGDIVSARDYPAKSRTLRIGSAVTIALTVNVDGRVSDCRIVGPSRDPEADAITCRLATTRFRFKPAHDATGRPVASTFGWRQRWFAPTAP